MTPRYQFQSLVCLLAVPVMVEVVEKLSVVSVMEPRFGSPGDWWNWYDRQRLLQEDQVRKEIEERRLYEEWKKARLQSSG